MAGQVSDGQHRASVGEFEGVVPVAADEGAGRGGQIVRGHVECAGGVVREPQGAAPRGKHGFLQLDRQPVLGLRDLPPALQRVAGLAYGALAPAQLTHVPEHGPHRGGAAVGVEHRLASHVQGPDPAVGPDDAELAVYRLAVDEAGRHHRGQQRLVLGEQVGAELVEGERTCLGGAAEDLEELLGPVDLVGEQVPLGTADAGVLGLGLGLGPGLRLGELVEYGGGGQALLELVQVLAQIVEMVHGEVAQRALPAALGVVVVDDGVAAHRVHAAAQPPGLRDQCVHRSRLGRLRGTVREQVGRHEDSDTGAARPSLKEGPITTVAQAAKACKAFGNIRNVLASGICLGPAGRPPDCANDSGLVRSARSARPGRGLPGAPAVTP